MIHFDLPKEKSSIIKVIGVGGGGSNAVNYMFGQDIDGVNFIICNTDAQALSQSEVPNKIQLGPLLTQGLGAGANPEIGRQATEESLEEIRKILEVNTKMAFITAGMGGGTGTGGAPILAKICKELGILTVGIVTTPFAYEGKKRFAQAEEGIQTLKDYVDTLLVISNDKLRHQYGNLTMRNAFAKADNVLATAAKCITDVINTTGQINVDFADVCTVMRDGGVAILGSATASGESRAEKAIQDAINSPLLNDNDIRGAKWILININSAEGDTEFTMDEVDTIQNHLISQAGEHTNVIMGLGYDNTLGDKIGITLIATGFEHKDPFTEKEQRQEVKEEKILLQLGGQEPAEQQQKKKMAQPEPALVLDPMAPRMVEAAAAKDLFAVTPVQQTQAERKDDQKEILNLEISSLPSTPSNETPIAENPPKTATGSPDNQVVKRQIEFNFDNDAGTTETSGGHSSSIYVKSPQEESSGSIEESSHLQTNDTADGQEHEMRMVIKEPHAADRDGEMSTHENSFVEEPAMQDEADDKKRLAAERLNKLRNLSFNANAIEQNSEYENVPAYVRRNFQLKNALASVEKFYSNYSVRTDEDNNAQISTINTFLDGEKPD